MRSFFINKKLIFIIVFLYIWFISISATSYQEEIKKNTELFKKATENFNNGEFQSAVEILEEILSFFETTREAHDIYYMLGKSYYALKQIDKSYSYLKKYQINFRYGKHTREVDELISYIENIRKKISEIGVELPDVNEFLSNARKLKENKMYDLAIVNLKKAIDIEPENPMYHHEMAVLYNLKNRISSYNFNVNYLENELEYYLKITENVVTPEIYYNIAFIYQRMDKYEKAIEYWRKVVDISPDTNIGKVSSVYIDKYQKNIEN